MKRLLMVSVITLSLTMSAEAGVDGERFEGGFTNSVNQSADLIIDFHGDGTFTWTVDFGLGQGPLIFGGTQFTELDFFIISFWRGRFEGDNTDVNGVSLFGFISTVNTNHNNGEVTSKGFLFHTGPAQSPVNTSTSPDGTPTFSE